MLVVHGNGEHDLQSRTVRRTRQPVKTLEDLALRALGKDLGKTLRFRAHIRLHGEPPVSVRMTGDA